MKLKLILASGLALFAGPALAAGSGAALPAPSQYDVVPLVSDQAGVAPNTDPDLVNAWGISAAPGGPLWISDNGTGLSTVYDPVTATKELVVTILKGVPTGTVYNSTSGFVISEGNNKGPAQFLFDSESGFITGWNFDVDVSNAVVAVDNSKKHSVYKGLAIDIADGLLFAADFHNNEVQVFNNKFKQVNAFTDTSLPKHFAPFNVAFINGQLYVAFAKREKGGDDEIDKKGLGYVDVFDTKGKLVKNLIANKPLDAPWAMLIAPSGFGSFAGDLLVGNFGNGVVNVFDPSTGDLLGALTGTDGKTLKIDGLWGLFAGPGSKVTFSAGPDDESHGLLGDIEVAGGK
jgi:uncharacterized protein (TIGR03118 family)